MYGQAASSLNPLRNEPGVRENTLRCGNQRIDYG
jgi:hypothetical protein